MILGENRKRVEPAKISERTGRIEEQGRDVLGEQSRHNLMGIDISCFSAKNNLSPGVNTSRFFPDACCSMLSTWSLGSQLLMLLNDP